MVLIYDFIWSGCTVFYPSDAVSTERATELAANTRGVCFIRVGRPVVPIVYENSEQFQIGKAKVVRQSDSDKVLVIAAGITLFEALKAADTLAAQVIIKKRTGRPRMYYTPGEGGDLMLWVG